MNTDGFKKKLTRVSTEKVAREKVASMRSCSRVSIRYLRGLISVYNLNRIRPSESVRCGFVQSFRRSTCEITICLARKKLKRLSAWCGASGEDLGVSYDGGQQVDRNGKPKLLLDRASVDSVKCLDSQLLFSPLAQQGDMVPSNIAHMNLQNYSHIRQSRRSICLSWSFLIRIGLPNCRFGTLLCFESLGNSRCSLPNQEVKMR